jgi:hypothetical protein
MEVAESDHVAVVVDDRDREALADVVREVREERRVVTRVERPDVVVDVDGRRVAATVDDGVDVA